MIEKNNTTILLLLMVFVFMAAVVAMQLMMLSVIIQARAIVHAPAPVEYNDGGAAGKFSSDVPIEDQILRADFDRKALEAYE